MTSLCPRWQDLYKAAKWKYNEACLYFVVQAVNEVTEEYNHYISKAGISSEWSPFGSITDRLRCHDIYIKISFLHAGNI